MESRVCLISCLSNSFRYVILFVTLGLATLMYANSVVFNFVVICINNDGGGDGGGGRCTVSTTPTAITINATGANANDTKCGADLNTQGRAPLSPIHLNVLIGTSSIGSIVSSAIVVYALNRRWTIHFVFSALGLLSALAALLTPMAANFGFLPLFFVRIIQGTFWSILWIMIGAVSKAWSPIQSQDSFMLALSSYMQLATLFIMPTAGFFCDSTLGWQSLYYMLGACTLVFLFAFVFIFRDRPEGHPCLSSAELAQIQKGKEPHAESNDERRKERPLVVPYGRMLTDPVVYIVLFAFFSDVIGFALLVEFTPTYLSKVLNVSMEQTGLFSALPSLLELFVKAIAGFVSNQIPSKSERFRINIFYGIALGGMIIAFFTLGILPFLCENPPFWVAQAAIMLAVLGELEFLGLIKCAQVISLQYSHILVSWISACQHIAMLFDPLLVDFAAPDNTAKQWGVLFLAVAGFEAVMMAVFFAGCDSKPRPWASEQQNANLRLSIVQAIDVEKTLPKERK